jgi:NitT/TauT family transport system substrate-binding protein
MTHPLHRRAPLTRRRLLQLGMGGAAGLLLAACGRGGGSGGAAAGPTASPTSAASFDGETVSMSVYSRNHASSPLFWERFAPEGLNVDIQIFTGPSDMNRAMEVGDLDFALMGVYNTLIEAEEGFTSKIIGMVSRRGMGFIAGADSGIESVADLRGKRIAVPPAGVQVLALTALLEAEGLDLAEDLEPVPLGFADHAAALAAGDVDAYAGTEPIAATSVVEDGAVRFTDPYDTPLGNFNTALWAAPHMQERPDLMRAAVAMQRGAAERLSPGGENDPAVWRDLLVDEFEYSPEVYEAVLDNIGAVWRFGDEQRTQMEGAAEAMLSEGVLTREPDIDSLLLLDYQDE